MVTTTSTTLINPSAYEPTHRARLEAAAQQGQASIYASGVEPGFLCDHLPWCCRRRPCSPPPCGVVNAVPYVVDAEPGLLRSLEMPLTLPRHALRPSEQPG